MVHNRLKVNKFKYFFEKHFTNLHTIRMKIRLYYLHKFPIQTTVDIVSISKDNLLKE